MIEIIKNEGYMNSDGEYFLNFVEGFGEKLKKEKKKLPYNFSLLDETKVNENTHSRILARLLEFDTQKIDLLKSLLKFLEGEFANLKLNKPIITCEKYRIDILIQQEKEFAIIIENKVKDAHDQPEQIDRYIKKVKDLGFKKKNIYVIYLTKKGGEPPISSFSYENRKVFKTRYKAINYKNHILPWIQKIHQEKTISRDLEPIIYSGIEQYINYLEGIFYMRAGELEMSSKLSEYINKKLKLDETNSSENLKNLEKYLDDIEELKNALEGKQEEITFKAIEIFAKEYQSLKEIVKIRKSKTDDFLLGEKDTYISFYPKKWSKNICIKFYFSERLDDLIFTICNDNGEKVYKNGDEYKAISSALEKKEFTNDNPNTNAGYYFEEYLKKIMDSDDESYSGILSQFSEIPEVINRVLSIDITTIYK